MADQQKKQSIGRRDLTGEVFGRWAVLGFDWDNEDGQKRWLCKCNCGNPNIRSIVGKSLTRTNGTRSCGKCAAYELVGKKIGKWTVLDIDDKSSSRRGYLLCKCSCGNPEIVSVLGMSLRNGESQSCGKCQQFEMIGKIFGRLTVLEVDKEASKIGEGTSYKCKCSCPNETIVTVKGAYLNSGTVKSCGCLKHDSCFKDISNQTFGYLTAIEPAPAEYQRPRTPTIWRCICSRDGNECYASVSQLGCGHVRSCGCLRSIGEANIQAVLSQNNVVFEKEKSFEDLKSDKNGYYRYDFYLPEYNRLIEFDGIQHFEMVGYFGREEQFVKTRDADKKKNEYARLNSIKLVRIPYQERDNITLDMLLGDKYLVDFLEE